MAEVVVDCSGYCGKPATTVVEPYRYSLRRDADGNLVAETINPGIRIPVCAACQEEAVAGTRSFTYCAADNHWGRTAFECRGGCGRRLVGWALPAL